MAWRQPGEEVAPRDVTRDSTRKGISRNRRTTNASPTKRKERNLMNNEQNAQNAHRAAAGLLVFAILLAALPAWGAADSKVVNVNNANASQLALLPRAGPSVAERIVDYRQQNGPVTK